MCGGFVLLASGEKNSRIVLGQVWYHLGRGLGYVGLGSVMGGMGDFAIGWIRHRSFYPSWWVVLLVISLSIYLLSLRQSKVRTRDYAQIGKSRISKIFRRISAAPFLLGVMTTFLPCPWLYSFVTVAAISGASLRGATVMCAFWLGTLPALFVAGTAFESCLRALLSRFPQVSLVALMVAAILSIMLHLSYSV